MRETQIKNRVLKFLRNEYPGIFVYKAADKFTAGITDLILCANGTFVGIELKQPGLAAKPIQEYQMSKIRKAGGRTAVCHSVEEVKQFMCEVVGEKAR
jgi:hypothetical protein